MYGMYLLMIPWCNVAASSTFHAIDEEVKMAAAIIVNQNNSNKATTINSANSASTVDADILSKHTIPELRLSFFWLSSILNIFEWLGGLDRTGRCETDSATGFGTATSTTVIPCRSASRTRPAPSAHCLLADVEMEEFLEAAQQRLRSCSWTPWCSSSGPMPLWMGSSTSPSPLTLPALHSSSLSPKAFIDSSLVGYRPPWHP